MKNRVSRVVLVFVILFSIFGPLFVSQARPARAFCLFLCADLDLGNLVQAIHDLNQLIDEEIPKLSDVMQKNLKELKDTLNGFVDSIDKTFQKDTKIVAAAINQTMQGVFLQAQDVLRRGYSMMSVLIQQGETAGKQLLEQLALEARALIDQFKEAAKEIIVTAVGGAVIVIDHATYE